MFKSIVRVMTAALCIPFAVIGFLGQFVYASAVLGMDHCDSFIDWISDGE
jgi:hypothetical protein